MEAQTFRSDIFYSVQNEDYQTELAVVHHLYQGEPLRVLMVASSGENALSVLADDHVGEVHAVDTNPAQIQLCELRRTALRHCSRAEQLSLLAADDTPEATATRVQHYDALRLHLPLASQQFWDARRDTDIAFGVHYVGRNDVLMREVQKQLIAAGFHLLPQQLRDEDLPTWQAAYAAVMTVPYFLNVFGLPNEAAAAKLASFAHRTAECHFRALQQPNAAHNYFLTTALLNQYALSAGDAGLPAYLQTNAQASLKQSTKLNQLYLHAGNIVEQANLLTANSGPFDVISISNIVEWMNDSQFDGMLIQLRTCLKPGGAILARSVSSSRMIIDGMAKHMRIDPALNQTLPQVERGPWFRTISAGFRA